jgi:C4-type Zn-finger protein
MGAANLTIQLVAFSPEAQVALEELEFNVSDGDRVTTGIIVVEGSLSTLFDKRPESALAGKPRSAPQTRVVVESVCLKANLA